MKTRFLLSAMLLCSVMGSYGQWMYDYLPQNTARMGAAVLDQKVYFAGGSDASLQPLSAIEVYDTKQEGWDTTLNLNMIVGRMHPACVAAGTRIFFAGGANMSTATMFSEVDIWDTVTKTWSYDELSVPRVFLSALSNGNKVLFAGGNNLQGSSYDVVDIYDLTTNSWEISALSLSRSGMGAAVHGDLAFFAGGYHDETSSVTDKIDIYHFSTGTWTTSALSQARGFLSAVTVRDKVLFAGGTDMNNEPSGRVDIYDAETGTWDTASLSVPRALFPDPSAAVINNRKAMFSTGGHFHLYNHNWTTDFNVIDIYDDSTGTWSTDSLTNPRLLHAVAGAGNYFVVAGGDISPLFNMTDKVEIFFNTDVWAGIDKSPEVENSFKVFPNPTPGRIGLAIGEDCHRLLHAHVFDMQGRQVFTQLLRGSDREINLQLPGGVYLLRIIADDVLYSEVIVVQ